MTQCPQCGEPLEAGARFCGGCGAALSSTERDSLHPAGLGATTDNQIAGREIAGRYRILSQLGQGGMGAVYRAQQISLKRTVALKLLRAELSQEPGLVRRFNAEAELAAKLNHPNTVTLFDFGQDHDGTLFIAMEFVAGKSLRSVMASEGPLPPDRALAIAKQICASLSDAHSHGIVHRDLKPDNVMLTERGKERDVVRVLDFGIAKLRDERGDATAMQMTQAGDLLGTPQYMAPEQIRGETVDGRTDVYALGAMLYEMVTGRLPFEAPTVMAILSKHLTEMPVSPASRRPDLPIPGTLDQLIMEALQKSPGGRPPSMEALGERVNALLTQFRANATTAQGTGSNPFLEPRLTTRPPGVPLTSPPGAVQAGVGTPVPGPGHATPPPAGTAAPTPAPMGGYPTGAAAAPPHKRSTAVIVAVVLVLALAAAAAGIIATRVGGSDSSDQADQADQTDQTGQPDQTDQVQVEGTKWMDPSGRFGLVVPPGFGPNLSPQAGVAMFEGLHAGEATMLIISGESAQGQAITTDLLNQAVDTIMMTSGGQLVEKGTRTIRGESYVNAIFDIPQRSMRGECVLYPRGDIVVIAMFGTATYHFADTGAARKELFEHRILLP